MQNTLCNGMAPSKTITAEQRLVADIRRKRSQLKRLQREIINLEIQLGRVRRTRVGGDILDRSTSVQRMTVESAVMRRLAQSVPPETSADQLWPLAQALGVTSRSTFRSHLRRMKEKGLLVSPSPGRWRLAPGVTVERVTTPEIEDALKRLSRS
jgi:hypothetical protein